MLTKAQLVARLGFLDDQELSGPEAYRLRIGPPESHRRLGFAELGRLASGAAETLRALDLREGARVALLLPHSERLPIWFFGAIYGGFIPCILAWPNARMDREKYQRNLCEVLASLEADLVVTEVAMAERLGAALGRARVIAPEPGRPHPSPPPLPRIRVEGTLFIQFSGGTTGTQKSVPITLEMLHRQLVRYAQVLDLTRDDRVISWLPLYHDMGLIACQLLPFAFRLPVTMFDPIEWVLDPTAFLRAVGEDRATLCWLPNFALPFMAAKVRPVDAELRLGSLRRLVNCSEPIRPESIAAFTRRFGPCGLRREAVHTCYAMAEATFAVTQSTTANPPRHLRVAAAAFGEGWVVPAETGRRVIVSSGTPLPGIDLRVVCPNGVAARPGQIGEIWLRGAYLMAGYLRPSSGDHSAVSREGWYRTGDLGTLLDGHLYVTGRLKDLIIVGGANVYAEDVEVAAAVPGVHPGRVVALGQFDRELGTERLLVVAEVDDGRALENPAGIEAAIRSAVVVLCGVAPFRVFLVPPHWIVKSTAGKISRVATRARLLTRFALSDSPHSVSNHALAS